MNNTIKNILIGGVAAIACAAIVILAIEERRSFLQMIEWLCNIRYSIHFLILIWFQNWFIHFYIYNINDCIPSQQVSV